MPSKRASLLAALLAALPLAAALAGCAAPQAGTDLVLATTTSTRDTGLLAHLLPDFEARHGVAVKVVAVGSGRALELGRTGDAHVVLSHAPAAERAALQAGHFAERREVMYNQFLLVGPPGDPAGLANASDLGAALRTLAEAGVPFVSRGDQSGTHLKEQELWALAGLDYAGQVAVPANRWYRAVGQGMGATLRIAAEQGAYCLTDDGTFHAVRPQGLAIVRSHEPPLRNQYSVLLRPPGQVPAERVALAEAFADWLTEPGTQARIGAFEVHGHRLFTPNAGAVERP